MVFLDGVRGFAALAVLGLHLTSAVPHGFVAVDLFFLLSGYVVAQAYEARLAAGGPPGWFIAVRAARLYPLYVAGMAVNFCRVLWVKPALAAGWLAQGLLFFPAVSTAHAMRSYFPLDTASWSLSLEILVNLLFAFGGWRLSNRALLTVAAAAAAFLVFAALRFGTADLGSGVEAGLIEYIGFPDALRGKYQCYTQADLQSLRHSGCEHAFVDVATGVAAYMDWLKGR